MYKIGDFSIISKTTVKALRYYETKKMLLPKRVDSNGYRYYETSQLTDIAKIISLKQMGLSLKEIKSVIDGMNIVTILINRKKIVEKEISEYKYQLSKINYLLEGKNMKYEPVVKELQSFTVYYKEGVIKDFSKLVEFILSSGEECLKANPGIKCITPDYCYVNYLDGE